MKRVFTVAAALMVVAVVGYLQSDSTRTPGPPVEVARDDGAGLAEAIERRASDVQVRGEGTVTRILADDREGSRHQRFILRLGSGETLLIAHNIDLAERVSGLEVGDVVAFHGEYEWNPRGGVVHWTHRDPAGRHADGWLRHEGRTYQ